ncbi:hypothetical protein CHU98_g4990 [Xylaria longipes]|nr:hypothetical protein CHU98_g4990 [Xylaria longipes]
MDTEVSTTKKRPGDSLPIGSPLEAIQPVVSERRPRHQITNARLLFVLTPVLLEAKSTTLTEVADQGSHDGEPQVPESLSKTSDSHPSLPIGVSLGIEGVITIIGGCVGILTILGFLAFLWFEYGPSPEASRAPYAWSQIALHDWMTQAITLSALVLRFTTSLQAAFIISGEATETPVPSLLTYNKSEFDFRLTSGFINRLPVYQIFAKVPSNSDASPSPEGLSDTGVIQRRFLPQAERDDRIALRRFDGNLMTRNSRVACARPIMDAFYETTETAADINYRSLRGRLNYRERLEAAGVSGELSCSSSECQELPFECSIPLSLNRATSWESVTCVVGGVGGRFWGIDLEPKWEPAEGPWSLNSTIHMVLSTNLRMIDWKTLPETGSLGSSEPYGEWLSFEPVDGHRLNITKFLGVDVPHRPHGERGILTMDIKGKPDDGPPGSPANDIVTIDGSRRTENHTIAELTIRVLEELLDYALSQSKNANSTLLLCYSCEALALPDHPVIAMLFSSIIAETGRAANALSSYMVVIGSTWYDAYRSSMLEMQNATTVTTKTQEYPKRVGLKLLSSRLVLDLCKDMVGTKVVKAAEGTDTFFDRFGFRDYFCNGFHYTFFDAPFSKFCQAADNNDNGEFSKTITNKDIDTEDSA